MSLNYTFDVTTPVTIAGVLVDTGIGLATLDLELEADLTALFAEIQSGNFVLKNKGVAVLDAKGIISTYSYMLRGKSELNESLDTDLEMREVVKEAKGRGLNIVGNSTNYYERAKAGQRYLFVETAFLVDKVAEATITQAEFERIEELRHSVKSELSTGNWKTTKNMLDGVINDASFTSETANVQTEITRERDEMVLGIDLWY